jgi:hypothetical protein
MERSTLFNTVDGTTIDYNWVIILSLVDEDGEIKVLKTKELSEPENRRACHADAASFWPKEHS